VNPDVRHHLDSALRLVPYCDSTSSDVVGSSARRVGLLSATIRIDVKIRNTGTESSGIRLKRAAERSLVRKYSPAEPDRAVTYSIVEMDEARKEVFPGTPVMVQACLRVEIWFDGWAKYDPIGYVRVARDLADCLSHPIDFVRITGVLDDGQEIASDLLVIIVEQPQRFEVEPLDVDELENHIGAIDAAIRPIPALENMKVGSLNRLNALRDQSATGELTNENRQQLASAADDLTQAATGLDHAVGGPADVAAALAAAQSLREIAAVGSEADIHRKIEEVLAVF
jgi:hypothetical protein